MDNIKLQKGKNSTKLESIFMFLLMLVTLFFLGYLGVSSFESSNILVFDFFSPVLDFLNPVFDFLKDLFSSVKDFFSQLFGALVL